MSPTRDLTGGFQGIYLLCGHEAPRDALGAVEASFFDHFTASHQSAQSLYGITPTESDSDD